MCNPFADETVWAAVGGVVGVVGWAVSVAVVAVVSVDRVTVDHVSVAVVDHDGVGVGFPR